MNDDSVAKLLRSEEPIVVIEAPAGCGKTFQAAAYAEYVCANDFPGKLLVLTHTHAACSVIAERTQNVKHNIEILTIDSLIFEIATAYRLSLGLPEDIAGWVRKNSYDQLADETAMFLEKYPFITAHIASLYPVVICDEHQDASESQDRIIQQIGRSGSKLRVFGDPMQVIPGGLGQDAAVTRAQTRWETLKARSAFEVLDIAHRWRTSNTALGDWILEARSRLRAGESINLADINIEGVRVLYAENGAEHPGQQYRLQTENWNALDAQVHAYNKTFVLARSNNTVAALRGAFRRRIPIWEGHTRKHVDGFVDAVNAAEGNASAIAETLIECLQKLIVGFSNSAYATRLRKEVQNLTVNPRGQKPPELKKMAECIVDSPCHRGAARAALHLMDLIKNEAPGFTDLHIDLSSELSDLIKLRNVEDPISGWIEINRRRSRSFPKPSRKALSTIHKAKGLETEHVMLLACDAAHFSDGAAKRNLLYVAMSRATHRLTFTVSRTNPSPLIRF